MKKECEFSLFKEWVFSAQCPQIGATFLRVNALFGYQEFLYFIQKILRKGTTVLLQRSDSTAMILRDKTYSYADLFSAIEYYTTLISQTDKRVAIFADNRAEWVFAMYAGWCRGAAVVPIDSRATAPEVSYIINDCAADIIFYSGATEKTLQEARNSFTHSPAEINLESMTAEFPSPASRDSLSFAPDVTALIIYTSGTTGSPKGVMLSFNNIQVNLDGVTKHIPVYTPERKVLVLLPVHHIFSLLGTLVAPLAAGAAIVFSPSLNSADIISTLQNNRVSILIGVPRFYEAILKGIMTKINASGAAKALYKLCSKIGSPAFSKKIFKKVHATFGGNVEYLVCGGAKLNESLAQSFKTLGFEMLEGFGMTEAAPMITFTRPGRWKIGSAGEPLPGTEVCVMNGEICARGPNIMQGYLNRPEETAAVIRDGWLHTGDLGSIDDDGFLHVTGRLKDIIVLSNGKNVNPELIENELKAMSPLLADAAVFESQDTLQCIVYPDAVKMKEAGITQPHDFIRSTIIDPYNSSAPMYRRLVKFFIVHEELPKTPLGKLKRYKLKDMITQSAAAKKKEEPKFEEYIVIKDYLLQQDRRDISPDDHFELDLKLDSLERVNFQVFLESTFGLHIDETTFSLHPTMERLAAYIREKKSHIRTATVHWSEILHEKIDHVLPKSAFTHNLFKNISKVFLRGYFNINVSGVENLPEAPFIITPNHQSFFDGLFVSIWLKKHVLKNTYFYAKAKHVRPRFVRALADRNNVIIMDIKQDLKLSMQKLASVLKLKRNVIIFPEGTRSTDGSLGEFKKFFAVLSLECATPIVPVSIKGAHRALPKGSFIPRPWKKIEIKFLEPVYPAGHTYDSLTELVYSRLAGELKIAK